MKKIKNFSKQIICIIIVLILCNFIMPNYTYAVDTEDGGSLMEVLAQFLCFIPDAVIGVLQDMFIIPESIKLEDGTYSIKYSPGVIFSGQVAALDINFINPGENKTENITESEYVSLTQALTLNGAKIVESKKYGAYDTSGRDKNIKSIKENYQYNVDREIDISSLKDKLDTNKSNSLGQTIEREENTINSAWVNEDNSKKYILLDYYKLTQTIYTDGTSSSTGLGTVYLYEMSADKDLNDIAEISGTVMDKVVSSKEYQSSAAVLQPIVSTWYNALRRIALVGLLSAIIYIGIRILLTSTSAKDKAKYKSMLKDWIIAVCLLFTLHYIMSITITVVSNINGIIESSAIAANGEDVLMTSVRNKILNGENWSTVLTYVVIYFVLVVFTVIYTIQYIRRIIYIAFLTMIAPLITLTYPLDKIKDSKSQAFDMWLKDYIFMSLIQVVHLLIYYVFLGSAINLAEEGNWLYALVAIAFIVPAEKIIKKMFGFEKSKTLGALGAGATGALVVNAMQKIPQGSLAKGGISANKETAEATHTKGVRTAGANPFVNYSEGDSANSPIRTASPSNSGANDNGRTENNNTNSKTQKSKNRSSKLADLLNDKGKIDSQSQTAPKLTFKKAIKGAAAVGVRYIPPIAEETIKAMSEVTGLTVGAASGKGLVNRVSNEIRTIEQVPEKIQDVVDTYREGAYGKEVAQNAKFDRVFRNSREYEDLKEKSGFKEKEFEQKLQTMLDAGISDTKQMKKILKNHRLEPHIYTMEKSIKYSKLAKECSEEILFDKVKFIKYCEDRQLGLSAEQIVELRENILNFK